jgi:thiaminase/transcriptional activator TenA
MTLSERLWQAGAQTYDEIIHHPFLARLADGTLKEEAFTTYVIQDALYLADYARSLSALAARASDAGQSAMFARHAAGALQTEVDLHRTLLPALGYDKEVVERSAPTPTTRAYTSYLLASTTLAPYPEAVAAVLPCYWIYAEVGKELARRGSPDERYQRWIDAYADEEYAGIVAEAVDAVDQTELMMSPLAEPAVTERYQTATRYEWMFWDAAWRRETWPL